VQDSDREAFDTILAEIFAAIDKPLGDAQRAVFWKGLKDLGLIEFARIRDYLVRQYREFDQPPRKFTIGDIWQARRKLRANAPPESPVDRWEGDEWDLKSNQRLLSYILRCWHKLNRHFTERETWQLLALKKRWAKLMRDSGTFESVPMADQDASWEQMICMAEDEMRRGMAA
jgi:hypothetical protein